MGIQNQIDRIAAAKAAILTELANKGVTVDEGANIEDIPDYIKSIETVDEIPKWTGGSY